MRAATDDDWLVIRARIAVHEDADLLVVDKPVGVSVLGERHHEDLMSLARDAGETLFPAHRIDKVTSGAVLLAKNLAVHGQLTRQFNNRSVDKAYLALTRNVVPVSAGRIELPLSVGRKNQVRIAAPRDRIRFAPADGRWWVPDGDVLDTRLYPSLTYFRKLWATDALTALLVRPVTGRRHQIRVHLAWIGYPILGDPLFDRGGPSAARTHLHSWRLGFDPPGPAARRLEVSADPGPDFWAPLAGQLGETAIEDLIRTSLEWFPRRHWPAEPDDGPAPRPR